MNRIVWEDMENVYSRSENWDWLRGKRVLITGAYGMVASYVVFFLIYLNETHPDMDIDILAMGRSEEKFRARYGEYCDRPYFCRISQDICAPMTIEGNVDYIFHAASYASSNFYGAAPVETLLPNAIGTHYLLELAREKAVKGFLFFSSGEVYGNVADVCKATTEQDIGVIDPMELRSCYAESKRMGETMCKAWQHEFGVPAIVVRLGHTYGPTMDLQNDPRVFAEFVKNVVNGQNIVMKSDGTTTRGFCYLADALDALFRVLQKGTPGEAYNLFNDRSILQIAELAHILAAFYPEKGIKVVKKDREPGAQYMESTIKNTPAISSDKLRGLGWESQFDAKAGFFRTVKSYEADAQKDK